MGQKDDLCLGVINLFQLFRENEKKLFQDNNSAFMHWIESEGKNNDNIVFLFFPKEYLEERDDYALDNLQLQLGNQNDIKKTGRALLSNFVTGASGKTGISGFREYFSRFLAHDDSFILKSKESFSMNFYESQIKIEFSLKNDLPKVFQILTRPIEDIKKILQQQSKNGKSKNMGNTYKKIEDSMFKIDSFNKGMLYLCEKKKYLDFFWFLFLYGFFQESIVEFVDFLPEIQYPKIRDFLRTEVVRNKLEMPFQNNQMANVSQQKFREIRRQIIKTARNEIMIAGASLKNAFNREHMDSIIDELLFAISNRQLEKISIFTTDPVIFDNYYKCNEPVNDISGTIDTLQAIFYEPCEENEVDLHIYFLPLLQIDHAVITEEFMVFRSNKLWNSDRCYKGAFNIYLANYFISVDSEYLAHKEYLETLVDNSTAIYPDMDVDYEELQISSLTGRHKQMIWRQYLNHKKYKHIYHHKLYEKQIYSLVCGTWSADSECIGRFIRSNKIDNAEELFNPKNYVDDPTQQILLPYIKITESLFDQAIKKHDSNGYCKIYPSLDLGFPNNVQRLAGGFATGMLVTWKCGIDIVPIDATVNVCTSSIFKLDNFDCNELHDKKKLTQRIRAIFSHASDDKGYSFNFRSGNHFLLIAIDKESKDYYLVLHSSASELKKSYMGLYPVEDNWYCKLIKIQKEGNRYLRYLKDEDATHFIKMAHIFQHYNEEIHMWLAKRINEMSEGQKFSDEQFLMKHHYYMPTDSSIAIGTFAEAVGESVPMFSESGKPIYIFKIGDGNFQVNIGGDKGNICVIPHGWGQKIDLIKNISIDEKMEKLILEMDEREPQIIPITSKEHINLKGKMLRHYSDGEAFLKVGKSIISGNIKKILSPCYEYSEHTVDNDGNYIGK